MVVWSICSELQKRESTKIYKGSQPITPIELKKDVESKESSQKRCNVM